MRHPDLKRITTEQELTDWAKMQQLGIYPACDLQDIYAHSQETDINKFFLSAKSDRPLILCAVYNTMSYDEVERLLKVLASHKCNAMIENEYKEIEKRLFDVLQQERTFKESMKPYHKRLTEYRKANDVLCRRNASLETDYSRDRETIRNMRQEIRLLSDKAAKYDQLKSLLS